MAKAKLLVIADDRDTSEMLRRTASEMFFSVQVADQHSFADIYNDTAPDVVVLDIVMADMTGFEVLQQLKDAQSPAIILLLSGQQASYRRLVEHLSLASGLNIHANLPKPFRDSELRKQLREIQMALFALKRDGHSAVG